MSVSNEGGEDDDRLGIQSVEIAAQILMQLVQFPAPVPLRQLSKAVGMAPNKVHRYLVSLTRVQLTVQDQESGRYGIGPAAISLGLAGLRMTDAMHQAFEALPALRDDTGETAVIGIWTRHGPAIARIEESGRPVFMNVRVGSILPLMRTAVGQIYATFLPRRDTTDLLDAEFREKQSHLTRTAFDDVRIAVRRHRFAAVQGSLVSGVTALAVPIFDHRGRLALALGLLGRTEDLTIERDGFAAKLLSQVSVKLSAQLGFDGTPPENV